MPALTIDPTLVVVPYNKVNVGAGEPSTALTSNVVVISVYVGVPLTIGAAGPTVGA